MLSIYCSAISAKGHPLNHSHSQLCLLPHRFLPPQTHHAQFQPRRSLEISCKILERILLRIFQESCIIFLTWLFQARALNRLIDRWQPWHQLYALGTQTWAETEAATQWTRLKCVAGCGTKTEAATQWMRLKCVAGCGTKTEAATQWMRLKCVAGCGTKTEAATQWTRLKCVVGCGAKQRPQHNEQD